MGFLCFFFVQSVKKPKVTMKYNLVTECYLKHSTDSIVGIISDGSIPFFRAASVASTGPLNPNYVTKKFQMGDYVQKKGHEESFNLIFWQQFSLQDSSFGRVFLLQWKYSKLFAVLALF